MKAKVDKSACVGNNDYVNHSPEVIRMRGEKPHVHVDDVPKKAEDTYLSAKEDCPSGAIEIEEYETKGAPKKMYWGRGY